MDLKESFEQYGEGLITNDKNLFRYEILHLCQRAGRFYLSLM